MQNFVMREILEYLRIPKNIRNDVTTQKYDIAAALLSRDDFWEMAKTLHPRELYDETLSTSEYSLKLTQMLQADVFHTMLAFEKNHWLEEGASGYKLTRQGRDAAKRTYLICPDSNLSL